MHLVLDDEVVEVAAWVDSFSVEQVGALHGVDNLVDQISSHPDQRRP